MHREFQRYPKVCTVLTRLWSKLISEGEDRTVSLSINWKTSGISEFHSVIDYRIKILLGCVIHAYHLSGIGGEFGEFPVREPKQISGMKLNIFPEGMCLCAYFAENMSLYWVGLSATQIIWTIIPARSGAETFFAFCMYINGSNLSGGWVWL